MRGWEGVWGGRGVADVPAQPGCGGFCNMTGVADCKHVLLCMSSRFRLMCLCAVLCVCRRSGGEAALGGPLGSAMPLPPALLTWVDSLAVSEQQTRAAAAAMGRAAVPEGS